MTKMRMEETEVVLTPGEVCGFVEHKAKTIEDNHD